MPFVTQFSNQHELFKFISFHGKTAVLASETIRFETSTVCLTQETRGPNLRRIYMSRRKGRIVLSHQRRSANEDAATLYD